MSEYFQTYNQAVLLAYDIYSEMRSDIFHTELDWKSYCANIFHAINQFYFNIEICQLFFIRKVKDIFTGTSAHLLAENIIDFQNDLLALPVTTEKNINQSNRCIYLMIFDMIFYIFTGAVNRSTGGHH